jgi:hypothetical protein
MKQLWQKNKGSISILAIFSIIAVLMMIFMSINIGNIYIKKNTIEDTAESIAPMLLSHQLEKYFGNYSGNDNAYDVADNLLDKISLFSTPVSSLSLNDKPYIITFGMVNKNAPGLPDGFYAFGTNESGNPTVSPTDPDLDKVKLSLNNQTGQDLAVAFQLNYSLTPLEQLVTFDKITLKGRAMHQTHMDKVTPPTTSDKDCCCLEVGGEYTFFSILGYFECSDPNTPKIIPCEVTFKKGICPDYFECHDTIFESFLKGEILEFFYRFFDCWFKDFVKNIIETITAVQQTVKDSWNGWT